MNQDEVYMREALAEAQKAYNKGEVPIGAVIVAGDGEIISRAHNLREMLNDATAHAEILAIKAAGKKAESWRLSDTTLYVTIEPCPMCAGAIVLARIKRLVYGASDPKGGAVTSLYNVVDDDRLNHQVEVTEGVLAQECSDIMRSFFRELRS